MPDVLPLLDLASLEGFAPPPSFSALAVPAAEILGNADDTLAGLGPDVASRPPVDVDDAFRATVAPAREQLENEAASAPGSPVPALITNGDNADNIRQSVLALLPSPDAPFDTNFVSPPAPPGGGELPPPGPDEQDVRDIVDQELARKDRAAQPSSGGGGSSGGGTGGSSGGGTTDATAAIREAIRQDYLSLLNREPDPAGWDYWTAQVQSGAMTLADVANAIINSDEYKALHSSGSSGGGAPSGGGPDQANTQ